MNTDMFYLCRPTIVIARWIVPWRFISTYVAPHQRWDMRWYAVGSSLHPWEKNVNYIFYWRIVSMGVFQVTALRTNNVKNVKDTNSIPPVLEPSNQGDYRANSSSRKAPHDMLDCTRRNRGSKYDTWNFYLLWKSSWERSRQMGEILI